MRINRRPMGRPRIHNEPTKPKVILMPMSLFARLETVQLVDGDRSMTQLILRLLDAALKIRERGE